jgi:hypothetical protein
MADTLLLPGGCSFALLRLLLRLLLLLLVVCLLLVPGMVQVAGMGRPPMTVAGPPPGEAAPSTHLHQPDKT